MSWAYSCVLAAMFTYAAACSSPCKCTEQSINCTGSRLTTVPAGLPLLAEELDISHNLLQSPALVGLDPFQELEYLDLSYNNLTVLIDSQFHGKLKRIRLDHNRIYFSGRDPFRGLETTLARLTLNSNQIRSKLSVVTFYMHKNLVELDLSENLIQELSNTTLFPASLKSLNLRNNPIARIHIETFGTGQNLKYLDLRGISMKTMKSSYFTRCSSLQTLKMGSRNLTEISGRTFKGLSALQTLQISNSELRQLPERVFSGLDELNRLDLISNKFGHFGDYVFENDSQISELRLHGDRGNLDFKSDLFGNLTNLRSLSLKNNRILDFPWNLTEKIHQLEHLNLSKNNLQSLQGPGTLRSLTRLNISDNNIKYFPSDFFACFPSLRNLDLSCNKLTNLSPMWWGPHLESIVTSGNPWSCDSSMCGVYTAQNVSFICDSTIRNTNRSYAMTEQCFVCDTPVKYKGQTLSNVLHNNTQFCDENKADGIETTIPTIYIIVVICAFSIFMLISVGAIVAIKRRQRMKTHSPGRRMTTDSQATVTSTSAQSSADGSGTCLDGTSLATSSSTAQLFPRDGHYQEIPETNGGYALAIEPSLIDHAYYGIAAHGPEGGETRMESNAFTQRCENLYSRVSFPGPGQEDARTTRLESDCSYITPHQASQSLVDTVLKQQKIKGNNPYNLVPDVGEYHGLPAPPLPPIPQMALQVDNAYEIDQGGKRTSYLDFRDPKSVMKGLDIADKTDPRGCAERVSAKHTYELE